MLHIYIYIYISISLNFNYIPYKVNKNNFFNLFTKNMMVNKKDICFDLSAYSNVYAFIYTNYFSNRWFLISY